MRLRTIFIVDDERNLNLTGSAGGRARAGLRAIADEATRPEAFHLLGVLGEVAGRRAEAPRQYRWRWSWAPVTGRRRRTSRGQPDHRHSGAEGSGTGDGR